MLPEKASIYSESQNKMSETFEMVAKTLYGLEDVLADELSALGAKDLQIGNGIGLWQKKINRRKIFIAVIEND